MASLQITYKRFSLKTIKEFRISRDSYNEREMLVMILEQDGYTGIGEASAHPFYKSDIDKHIADIKFLQKELSEYELTDPATFWNLLFSYNRLHPFLISALDVAAYDLISRSRNKTISEVLSISSQFAPRSMYTISMNEIAVMQEEIQANPWPFYKIKMNNDNVIPIIKALREVTTSKICIDANCSWTAESTLQYSSSLQQMGVEFVEQPLAANQYNAMVALKKSYSIDLIADESCTNEEELEKCLLGFDGINCKIMKNGGITPTVKMIKKAKNYGLKIMGGCMMESSVGISALAQISPLMDYIDMDSILLISNDYARGVKLSSQGDIILPDGSGHGAELLD